MVACGNLDAIHFQDTVPISPFSLRILTNTPIESPLRKQHSLQILRNPSTTESRKNPERILKECAASKITF